jgi:predicted SAM-dependent methyltransferase
MKFSDIYNNKTIYLYLGDIEKQRSIYTGKEFIGLSLRRDNDMHVRHDVTKPYDLKDDSVDIVQSEDVMEHIEYAECKDCINEIYRVLKPGGLFRLSMPTYECDVLYNRSLQGRHGKIIFDPDGGGSYDYVNKKVTNGGHVWFPTYASVKEMLLSTNFKEDKINFLHYYDSENNPIIHQINYSLGFIERTPDHDIRAQNPKRPLSIVVDCRK